MVMPPPGGARAVARCDELGRGRFSEEPDMLFRAFLTPAHAAALERLAGWMAEAGMSVRLDGAANLIGRYEGQTPGAPCLLTGSHIDSVRDGGNYDGPLGIMLGIETVAALHAAGERPPFAIEVIAFGDEEGSRFPASMICSRAAAGSLPADATDGVVDRDGLTLDAALQAFPKPPGVPAPILGVAGLGRAGYRPGTVLAFLEAHIEQGPVLEAEGLALGTVTGIAAQLRFRAVVSGRAGHAGTTAMGLRADALAGAAEMVLAVERIATDDSSDLVATVGRLSVAPGAVNVVPGRVEFSVDVRSGEVARRDAGAARIGEALHAIAAARGLGLTWEQVQDLPASPCDPQLMALLDAAIADLGLPVRRLVSGAGHDAMVMAGLAPMAMLFIRCAGGISHNPAEKVDPADVELALQAMLGFVRRFGDVPRA
ncbi:allantoate amidohydrolase [Sphingomonas naphthae]|uniref:Allantoate amidohydrolase n=1 Tax=Sphingomonas naphthae TaxID=1813468 RepID=A0ABY7TKH2_9SPHN|nr:allantoate amidohydrolase [Sphingomonas naphthae]WCT73728.1 allantoate amidohydrolase [Sphingomonas naphthae]